MKLAKEIKCLIGNKAAIGDAEEDFDLEDVAFGAENTSTANHDILAFYRGDCWLG